MEQTIRNLYSALNEDEELVLVENGSTDNTLSELKSLFGTTIPANIIVTQSSKGLGLALKHGIELASG